MTDIEIPPQVNFVYPKPRIDNSTNTPAPNKLENLNI